jgi:copper(I)-binding protein
MEKMRTNRLWLLIASIAILALSACQENEGPALTIENAWGRPSPMNAKAGALYMEIHNSGSQSDKLLAAESSACGVIEIHETVMKDDVMSMQPVPEGYVLIPAGETVVLETGGLHLMCIDKQSDFEPGVSFPLTLRFEKSGELTFDIEVKNP